MAIKNNGKVYVLKIKILDTLGIDTSRFEQMNGESLKDAWFRINELHSIKTNPCSEAKGGTNFAPYGLCHDGGVNHRHGDLHPCATIRQLGPHFLTTMAGHLGGPYHGFSYTHHIYHV
jgi:hypothetical protein